MLKRLFAWMRLDFTAPTVSLFEARTEQALAELSQQRNGLRLERDTRAELERAIIAATRDVIRGRKPPRN